MLNKNKNEKQILLGIVCFFIVLSVSPVVMQSSAGNTEKSQFNTETVSFYQDFSTPIVTKEGQYVEIAVNGANSWKILPNAPKIPVFTKTFELPWKTKGIDIKCEYSNIKSISLSNKVKPVLSYQWLDGEEQSFELNLDKTIYNSLAPYPSKWFTYNKGCGINKDGVRVLFLSFHVYPVRYIPANDILEYIDSIKITVTYKTEPYVASHPTYDLVIIGPTTFYNNLEPLIDHKTSHGIKTIFASVEDIYNSYPGRDKAEQIKYYIKNAIEQYNVKYVLLVGDIRKLPIRHTCAYPWQGWGGDILSDQYYADIYDANQSFCSWDSNGNDKFGEVDFNFTAFPPEMVDLDGVDLYPDVFLGRLACRDANEVDTVVNKIITYEDNTYGQSWFNKIVLIGGDTFPLSKGAPPFVYEGEITNQKVAEKLPLDFKQIRLWTSKHNLHPFTFNREITKGAGFVSYAGHGFEHGWGTFRPNAVRKKMIIYFTPYLQGIKNHDKLPIIFFDACLTAKLDFNMSDLVNYYPRLDKLYQLITGTKYDPLNYYPCFAWCFLSKENGGGISVIGATRPAYTMVDKGGVYAGAGYLDVGFFDAYEKNVTVSQMFVQSQNNYLNNVGRDYFTLEEFMLLGDPSLMVGGYAS